METEINECPKCKKDLQADGAWKMMCELRQEIRDAQKIRTQVIGIKITFIAAAFGLIFKASPINYELLFIPAFTSLFFDFLIISYGFSIKRIGYYCRCYLEPKIRHGFNWPDNDPLWEEAMNSSSMKQQYARTGNFGITLVTIIGTAILIVVNELSLGTVFFLVLLCPLAYYIYKHHDSNKYVLDVELCGKLDKRKRWFEEKCNLNETE